jgi:hypothetical protein
MDWDGLAAVMSRGSLLLAGHGPRLAARRHRTSSGHVVLHELSWFHGIPPALAEVYGYPSTLAELAQLGTTRSGTSAGRHPP